MVNAIVLMNIARGRVGEMATTLAGIEGIAEVYSVGGRFDLVAILRVASNDAMATLVTEKLASLEGIENTETLLAFQSHSRHDLESMFAIGN